MLAKLARNDGFMRFYAHKAILFRKKAKLHLGFIAQCSTLLTRKCCHFKHLAKIHSIYYFCSFVLNLIKFQALAFKFA